MQVTGEPCAYLPARRVSTTDTSRRFKYTGDLGNSQARSWAFCAVSSRFVQIRGERQRDASECVSPAYHVRLTSITCEQCAI